MSRPRHSQDVLIATMRREGQSLKRIMEATGLSMGQVCYAIRHMGLPVAEPNERKTQVDALVENRREEGASWHEIATMLGVSERVVRRRAAKIGILKIGERRPPQRTSARRMIYAADHAAGLSLTQVAEKHSVSYVTVWKAVKAFEERSRGGTDA